MLNKKEIMSLFPLKGSNIKLSIFEENDINDSYIAWLNDAEVVKYSNQRFIKHTKESSQQYYLSTKDSEVIFIAIRDCNTEDMIGTMTAYLNNHHRTADMGILLGNKDYWGKGIGSQAWNLLLNCLIDKAAVRKVTGGAVACNRSMVSIMQRSNMLPDGVRASQELVDGEQQDIVHYAAFNGKNEH